MVKEKKETNGKKTHFGAVLKGYPQGGATLRGPLAGGKIPAQVVAVGVEVWRSGLVWKISKKYFGAVPRECP